MIRASLEKLFVLFLFVWVDVFPRYKWMFINVYVIKQNEIMCPFFSFSECFFRVFVVAE